MFLLLCGCGRAKETAPPRLALHPVTGVYSSRPTVTQRSYKTSLPLPTYRENWVPERLWEVPGIVAGVVLHARPCAGWQALQVRVLVLGDHSLGLCLELHHHEAFSQAIWPPVQPL